LHKLWEPLISIDIIM